MKLMMELVIMLLLLMRRGQDGVCTQVPALLLGRRCSHTSGSCSEARKPQAGSSSMMHR